MSPNTEQELRQHLSEADVLVHLAGINRPLEPAEFMTGNVGLTSTIAEYLEKSGKALPMIFSSSIQAELDNDYGKSKRLAEERLKTYAERTGAPVRIFRFANIFGKWGRPNYNSAVITFCYNIARELPITIHDPTAVLKLIYVDDPSALQRLENHRQERVQDVQTNDVFWLCDSRQVDHLVSFQYESQVHPE